MSKFKPNYTIKELVAQARELFGKERSRRNMRRQWILKTKELMARGIHLKQTGKFPSRVTLV